MHETDPFTANAPNYRYGFLSGALHQIFSRPIGAEFGAEERRQLDLGLAFLADLVAGVSLVSRGETRAASPTRAVGVLDYALGPLQAIERLRTEEGALSFLEQILHMIEESLAGGRLTGDAALVAEAKEFFGHLSDDIVATLNRRSRAPRSPGGRAALM